MYYIAILEKDDYAHTFVIESDAESDLVSKFLDHSEDTSLLYSTNEINIHMNEKPFKISSSQMENWLHKKREYDALLKEIYEHNKPLLERETFLLSKLPKTIFLREKEITDSKTKELYDQGYIKENDSIKPFNKFVHISRKDVLAQITPELDEIRAKKRDIPDHYYDFIHDDLFSTE